MTWVKLDDGFPDHPKVTSLPLPARWLHVCALCYCSKYLTDGRLTHAQALALHRGSSGALARPHRGSSNGSSGAQATFGQLVECGLWERRGEDFEIHDFLRYNPSREQVLSERAAARERMGVRRKFAGSSPEHQANVARSSPSPSRPGRKDKSSSASRKSGSPEHDPGLQVEEYTDPSGRLRFRSRIDQPPPPELPPVDEDELDDDPTPPELPDQTDPTTADNLPEEPW